MFLELKIEEVDGRTYKIIVNTAQISHLSKDKLEPTPRLVVWLSNGHSFYLDVEQEKILLDSLG